MLRGFLEVEHRKQQWQQERQEEPSQRKEGRLPSKELQQVEPFG